ncbi:MAG: hypothetical protein IPN87_06945 [Saprospiraceae bacterium]|nr:hypothetical protein [Candidatus Brachybacter algidus]MBK8844564.1 hypothetical protein [Candidatus Brachybacter algidus]
MKKKQTPIRPTLHPYIPHLISDIQNAFRPKEKTPQRVMTFEEQMEEAENFVTRPLGFQTFSSYCGLTREHFPPSEQLSDADMQLVIPQFVQLLKTWHADVHLSEKMPVSFQYDLLIETLEHDFMYMEHGFMGIDFCTGNWDGCRLGEYCGCLQWK